MNAIDAVLLTLRANAEEEKAGGASMTIGRTAMQKLVYLASLKVDVDTTYYAHYYGPFSEGVSMGIARLWGQGHVHEDSPTRASPGYTYTLTKDGECISARVAGGEMADDYSRISAIVRTCRDFCGLRQPQLAFAAKVHYIKRSKNAPQASVQYLMEIGRKSGWEMSEDDVNSGLELLRRLEIGQ